MISNYDNISDGAGDHYNKKYIQSELPSKHSYSDQNNHQKTKAETRVSASSHYLDSSNARLESTKVPNKTGMKYDYNRNKSGIIDSDEENIYPDGEEEYNKILHKYGMHRNAGQPRPKR